MDVEEQQFSIPIVSYNFDMFEEDIWSPIKVVNNTLSLNFCYYEPAGEDNNKKCYKYVSTFKFFFVPLYNEIQQVHCTIQKESSKQHIQLVCLYLSINYKLIMF